MSLGIHTDGTREPGERGAKFDPSVLSSSSRASRADGVVITREPLDAGETVDLVPFTAVE